MSNCPHCQSCHKTITVGDYVRCVNCYRSLHAVGAPGRIGCADAPGPVGLAVHSRTRVTIKTDIEVGPGDLCSPSCPHMSEHSRGYCELFSRELHMNSHSMEFRCDPCKRAVRRFRCE